jgi:hypothetical protein
VSRQRGLFPAPEHATIAPPAAAAPVTFDVAEELAALDREQARILLYWSRELEAAQRANDWQRVARVRVGIAAASVVLEELAGDARRSAAALRDTPR